MQENEQSTNGLKLPNVSTLSINEELIRYNDDELLVIDNLRELPGRVGKIAFNIVVTCRAGSLQADVAGQRVTVGTHQIIICRPHVVISNLMISPDLKCTVMCFSDHLLNAILQSQMLVWNNLLYTQRYRIIEIPENRIGIYNELHLHWLNDKNPFKHEIIVSLLRVALLDLCNLLLDDEKLNETDKMQYGYSRMETLFHRFQENIARRHIKKISVTAYADELCITPKYLSTICHNVSGKSPKEWILEYVIQDITHYLRNTDLSIKEISDELGFTTPSFFGRYVRKHLGMTPYEYRKKLLEMSNTPNHLKE